MLAVLRGVAAAWSGALGLGGTGPRHPGHARPAAVALQGGRTQGAGAAGTLAAPLPGGGAAVGRRLGPRARPAHRGTGLRAHLADGAAAPAAGRDRRAPA